MNNKIKEKIGKSDKRTDVKQIKKLTDYLVTTPTNVTLTVQHFDCVTFAAALKSYFDDYHGHYAIRNVMVTNKLQTDLSLPLDPNEITRLVAKLHCKNQISTDKSVFQVFKYLTGSLVGLAKSTGLTNSDMVELFYPFVEMNDRFDRVLPSHSYLNYFLENYDPLFQANSCGGAKQAVVEAPAADEEDKDANEEASEAVTTTKKSIKAFFNKFKKAKKE